MSGVGGYGWDGIHTFNRGENGDRSKLRIYFIICVDRNPWENTNGLLMLKEVWSLVYFS